MRAKSGVALLIGFGTVLFLVGFLGVGAARRTTQMYERTIASLEAFQETDQAVRDLPADLHVAGLLVRDYVLDSSPSAAASYREQLTQAEHTIEQHLSRLSRLSGAQQETGARLRREVRAYVASFHPMLSWTPAEKRSRGYGFIRENLVARRQAIVRLAHDISALNAENLALEQARRAADQAELQRFLRNSLAGCLALGVLVAFVSTFRVVRLEARTSAEIRRTAEAEREQHRLAMRVAEAHEEERRRLSRELHDAVGQAASAIGMQLGQLAALRGTSPEAFDEKLTEIRRLNTDVVRAIKDLATGLRPAMLDDLGLGSALRAHVREFSRRCSIAASVKVDGHPESVPEPYRTCVYRVVQEALNNCGRHSQAKNVVVSLYGGEHVVTVTVQDDGIGFDASRPSRNGLGLMGMRERVQDLNGTLTITSTPHHGTLLEVALAIREGVTG